MNIARHLNHRRKQTACSSQEPFAYNENLQQPTIAVLLITILIFFSQNMRGFSHAMILIPSFHGLR